MGNETWEQPVNQWYNGGCCRKGKDQSTTELLFAAFANGSDDQLNNSRPKTHLVNMEREKKKKRGERKVIHCPLYSSVSCTSGKVSFVIREKKKTKKILLKSEEKEVVWIKSICYLIEITQWKGKEILNSQENLNRLLQMQCYKLKWPSLCSGKCKERRRRSRIRWRRRK